MSGGQQSSELWGGYAPSSWMGRLYEVGDDPAGNNREEILQGIIMGVSRDEGHLFDPSALQFLAYIEEHDSRLWGRYVRPILKHWYKKDREHFDKALAEARAQIAHGALAHASTRRNGHVPEEETPQPGDPILVRLSEIEEKPLAWVWYPYLARGHLAFVDGDPGLGKSLFAVAIASLFSRAHPLPDQQGRPTMRLAEPQRTLLLTAEDSLQHTVKRRVRESGGDDDQIVAMPGWYGEEGEVRHFTLQHLPVLTRAMEKIKPLLVIIDPIAAYLGQIDMHRSNETRPLMQGLKDIADAYGAIIACVRHPSKPTGSSGKALYRGQGNIDLVGAARSAFFAEQHPSDTNKVLLCHYKSNHGPLGRTLIFSKMHGRFEWCGVTRLTAETIAGDGRTHTDPKTYLKACLWLEQFLAGGIPQPSADVLTAAEEEGFTRKDMLRAKDALQVTSHKRGIKEGWDWRLPDLTLLLEEEEENSSSSSSSSSSSNSWDSSRESTSYTKSPEESGSSEHFQASEASEESRVFSGPARPSHLDSSSSSNPSDSSMESITYTKRPEESRLAEHFQESEEFQESGLFCEHPCPSCGTHQLIQDEDRFRCGACHETFSDLPTPPPPDGTRRRGRGTSGTG